MVSLSEIKTSNSLISSTFPPGLVAIFAGGTSGIGETSLKKFAQYAQKPRCYIIGRSQTAADRIVAECKDINPEGEYIFIKADLSLIKNVDKVCSEIKAKEKTLNLLFLSWGGSHMDRQETSEHLHLLTAVSYYARVRFIEHLLPLLKEASSLRRVVFVAGGGMEGPIYPEDFQALRLPLTKIRGHLSSLVTLGLEAVEKQAPEVSFVHDFPGMVNTQLFERTKGIIGVLIRFQVWLLGRWLCVPIDECGERHLYFATSARYRAERGDTSGVKVIEPLEVALGSNGKHGSGVYSVKWDGESASPTVIQTLAGLREKGMVEQVWKHTEGEFKRITETEESS